MNSNDVIPADVVVLGGGPGGYTAAFFAADKGKKVILVEQEQRLGGVCLNSGCIPSKALLHASELLQVAKDSEKRGIHFGTPEIDLLKLRSWKESILTKLSGGIQSLATRRGVEVLIGHGTFEASSCLRVETKAGVKVLQFQTAIIASGSKSAMPKAFDLGSPRIMTSREALNLGDIPQRLLVVGGGYIGMEMGSVYASLGSQVVMVEALPSILAGADPDLVRPVMKLAEGRFKEIKVSTRVKELSLKGEVVHVIFEKEGKTTDAEFDRVLIAVGRVPNSGELGLEKAGVQLDDRGFIKVNTKQQTNVANIYAVGDVAGGAMLAHKASKEARVAVEVIAGGKSEFEKVTLPAVVFTDPEIAWCGLTEQEARQKQIAIEVVRFPWSASGRALTFDRTDGVTKFIVEPGTEKLLGVGICGHGAGELISEGVLAIEMGATVHDIANTVHPHPTLSETYMECAEMFYGTSTHAFSRKRAGPVAAS